MEQKEQPHNQQDIIESPDKQEDESELMEQRVQPHYQQDLIESPDKQEDEREFKEQKEQPHYQQDRMEGPNSRVSLKAYINLYHKIFFHIDQIIQL